MPVVVDICSLDPVRLEVEHGKSEPGPVLAVFSYAPRAVPGDVGCTAGRRAGIGQDGHAAITQAPRVADACRLQVSDRPVLVSPPPRRDAVRVQYRRQLGREGAADIRPLIYGDELVMAEQDEAAH